MVRPSPKISPTVSFCCQNYNKTRAYFFGNAVNRPVSSYLAPIVKATWDWFSLIYAFPHLLYRIKKGGHSGDSHCSSLPQADMVHKHGRTTGRCFLGYFISSVFSSSQWPICHIAAVSLALMALLLKPRFWDMYISESIIPAILKALKFIFHKFSCWTRKGSVHLVSREFYPRKFSVGWIFSFLQLGLDQCLAVSNIKC